MNPQEQPVTPNRSEQPDGDETQTSQPGRTTRPELHTQSAASRSEDGATQDRSTPYLEEQSANQAGERWRQVQAAFVDDPRKAVTQAHELVGELTQRIVDAFARERAELERQWSSGDNVSTEDLRVCLKRYRAFFSRLLPSVNKLTTSD